jgi:hypothetical protein
METEVVSETLDSKYIFTWRIAREDSIAYSRRESLKSYILIYCFLKYVIVNICWIRCDRTVLTVAKNTGLNSVMIAVLLHRYYVYVVGNAAVYNSDFQEECHCYILQGNYSFLLLNFSF